MFTKSNIRNKYETIQRQLLYMIPEKWDKVFLYASVIEHYSNIQTGEMFFYYYPKGVLKKNPVNVYEVPVKFNIDEKSYLKLAEKLYKEIKELRIELIKLGEKPWSNLTITIENLKFNVIYNYDDLINSKLNNNARHLIWKCKYLGISPETYSKKNRKMVEDYLKKEKLINIDSSTYQEGIYKKYVGNINEFEKQEEKPDIIIQEAKEDIKQDVENIKNQILKFN